MQIIRKRAVSRTLTECIILLLCLLLSAWAEAGVPVISNQRVTDIATSSFSVILTVNEPSTAALPLFAADCTTPATGFASTIQENSASGNKRLTVTGLSTATTYCYKLALTSTSNSQLATSPLAQITTATIVTRTATSGTDIIPTGNDILRMTDVHLPVGETRDAIIATVELLDGSAASPLSLLLSSNPNSDYFNLNNLFATTTGKSLDLVGGERVKITEIHGVSGCVIERYRTIPVDAGGTVARSFTRANPNDIDASGGVDNLDVQRIVAGQGTTSAGSCFNSDLDLDGNGAINSADLTIIEGIVSYTVTFASGGNGTLTGSASQTINYGGSATTVTAVPAPGYHFVNWAEGGTEVATTAALTISNVVAAHNYIANFVAIIDTTAPTLVVSSLANGAITNNATLNVSGTVADTNGVGSLTINATAVTVTSGSFSHAVTLQTGSNTITTIATDTLGNSTTDTRTITLDQTAPTLSATAPADNSKTAVGYTTITGTINETSTVTVTVNSNTQSAAITGNNFSATVNLAVGLNTITIAATDLANNTTSVVRTVTYDNTNPSLAITNPGQDITTSKNSIIISGTVSNTITTATVKISFNGQTYTPTITNGTFSQQLTIPAEGTYTITATATDEAGNSSSATRNVIYKIPLLCKWVLLPSGTWDSVCAFTSR